MDNHQFLIGKPSINGPFSMAMLNNQRIPEGISIRGYSSNSHFIWYVFMVPSQFNSRLAGLGIYESRVDINPSTKVAIFTSSILHLQQPTHSMDPDHGSAACGTSCGVAATGALANQKSQAKTYCNPQNKGQVKSCENCDTYTCFIVFSSFWRISSNHW